MMNITLYRGTKLSPDYNQVFRNKTLLNDYLDNSLLKLEFNGIDCYPTLQGQIILSVFGATNFYPNVYNYMKFINPDNTTEVIYAFVTNVEISNGSMLVNYIQDIWHTYLGQWNIYASVLNRTIYPDLHGVDIISQPIKYLTNSALQEYSIINNGVQKLYNVIFKLRLYQTSTSGEATAQLYTWAIINKGIDYNLNITECINIIRNFYDNRVRAEFGITYGEVIDYLNYEIDECYLLPSQLNFSLNTSPSNDNYRFYITNGTEKIPTDFNFTRMNYNELDVTNTYTVLANPEIVSIGTLTNRIEVPYNGKDITVWINIKRSYFNFKIYMYLLGQYIDITNDFAFDYPTGTISNEENQLRKLNKTITDDEIAVNYATTSMRAIGGLASGLSTGISGIITLNGASTANGLNSFFNTGANTIDSIYSNYNKSRLNNAELYETGYTNKMSTVGDINFRGGVYAYSIHNPININQIENEISNYGYLTQFIVNSVFVESDEINFDYVKFDKVNVINGNRTVSSVIENILLNGTRIIYKNE